MRWTGAKIIGIVGFVILIRAAFILFITSDPRADVRDSPEAIRARFAMYNMYSATSHKALDDIRAFVSQNNVRLPLFEDLSDIRDGNPEPKICVGIQTAARPKSPYNYLEQLVGALLARMPLPADDVYIHIFNVQALGETHPGLEAVDDLLPVSRIKGELPPAEDIVLPMIPQYAEAHDHLEAMRVFDRIGCQYPIFIEDDSLPQEGWLEMVREAISQLVKRDRDWFLVKLYVARPYDAERPDKSYVGITDYDQEFNSVAFMYNPKYMLQYGESLVEHTRDVMTGKLDFEEYLFKDTYLNLFQEKTEFKVQAFEPPIFQHTGVFSSVNNRPLDVFPFGMESREFASQGKPIVFNETLWAGLVKNLSDDYADSVLGSEN